MGKSKEKVAVHVSPRPAPEVGEDAFSPLVDIHQEADGTVVVEAELPGVPGDKVDVRVDKGVLTIYADGRRDPPGKDYTYTYQGFTDGEFFRAFALSDEGGLRCPSGG